MIANPILLGMKYARIVAMFAEQKNMSWEEALSFFYQSETYDLMSHGISDMHCRSDIYLVDELKMEYDHEGYYQI